MQMYDLPDPRGHFGPYGGVFVAETLSHALDELREHVQRFEVTPPTLASAIGRAADALSAMGL